MRFSFLSGKKKILSGFGSVLSIVTPRPGVLSDPTTMGCVKGVTGLVVQDSAITRNSCQFFVVVNMKIHQESNPCIGQLKFLNCEVEAIS